MYFTKGNRVGLKWCYFLCQQIPCRGIKNLLRHLFLSTSINQQKLIKEYAKYMFAWKSTREDKNQLTLLLFFLTFFYLNGNFTHLNYFRLLIPCYFWHFLLFLFFSNAVFILYCSCLYKCTTFTNPSNRGGYSEFERKKFLKKYFKKISAVNFILKLFLKIFEIMFRSRKIF